MSTFKSAVLSYVAALVMFAVIVGLVAFNHPASAAEQPHVGDVLIPTKPGTEIVTQTLQVPKIPNGHVPAKVCTDHAQHVLESVEVDLPAIPNTKVHARSMQLMTGVKTTKRNDNLGWVTGWSISDFSVEVLCQMDNDVVFFVVAGPNYEDGTASVILQSIQKKWNEGADK
jgi:hypothetical protein